MCEGMYFYYVCMRFFFSDPATTEIYTLSLHDALPIFAGALAKHSFQWLFWGDALTTTIYAAIIFVMIRPRTRSEEHTSELQSRFDLVCRLLLEKKKKIAVTRLDV